MKKVARISLLSLIAVCLLYLPANAAKIDFMLQNVDLLPDTYDTGISSFIWQFDETSDVSVLYFDETGAWSFISNADTVVADGYLKLQGIDNIWAAPLSDGKICTLEYTGTLDINNLSFEFRDYVNNTITEMRLVGFDLSEAGNITFSPVPIPSAILLLGGGLIGMFGIRRKMKN